MKVVYFSDTHERHRQLLPIPDGDLLIFGGDCTTGGDRTVFEDFCAWFFALPHRYKIFIRGNHDAMGDQIVTADVKKRLPPRVWLLDDELINIDGIAIYGTPFHPSLHGVRAELRTRLRREAWAKIPPDIDILITHAPPHGILDTTGSVKHAGCKDLLSAVYRAKPRWHLFGHIHEAAGVCDTGERTFVNGAIVNAKGEVARAPFCFEIAPAT
jgi:Icc-related predicted phosphoesterase